MNEPEVFELANRELERVVLQISDHQWDTVVPTGFVVSRSDTTPTLRQIVDYHAYDDAWVPDMLAGLTMEEAGKEKFDGDLLGTDPKESFSALVEKACAAARNVRDLDSVVHCSFGDYSTREYLWQINSFRGLRAHDIATVIGVDSRLPDDLVKGLWDEISPNAEEWRKIGVFPAAVPVEDDASLQDRLLGLTGRRP